MTKEEVLQAQLQAINDLYISERGKYILQNKDGTYSHSNAFKNNKRLTDPIVIRHLKRQSTLGVFCPKKSTKFITFDVDLEGESESYRREVVDNIIKHIVNVGIDRRFVYVSLSGSKGYHITLYFSDMVYLNLAYKFYEYVIFSSGYNNIQVEFRPTPSVGMKIPLSLNRKTKVKCDFVDDNFNIISDELFITKILKFDRDIFQEESATLKVSEEDVKHYRVVDYNLSPNKFKKLKLEDILYMEENGLTESGTRNYYSVQIAMMYYSMGLSKEMAVIKLNEWIDRQDASFYKTNIVRCYVENRKIVDWVFNNNIKLAIKKNTVVNITESEVELIRSIDKKYARKVALALLIHWKVYGKKDFTMTYNQLFDTNMINNRRYIKKAIDILIELNYTKITKRVLNGYKEQNVYSISIDESDMDNILYTLDVNNIDYYGVLTLELKSSLGI